MRLYAPSITESTGLNFCLWDGPAVLVPPKASYKETMATFNMAPRSESSYVRGRIQGDRILGT
jgi:hypothetical protein